MHRLIMSEIVAAMHERLAGTGVRRKAAAVVSGPELLRDQRMRSVLERMASIVNQGSSVVAVAAPQLWEGARVIMCKEQSLYGTQNAHVAPRPNALQILDAWGPRAGARAGSRIGSGVGIGAAARTSARTQAEAQLRQQQQQQAQHEPRRGEAQSGDKEGEALGTFTSILTELVPNVRARVLALDARERGELERLLGTWRWRKTLEKAASTLARVGAPDCAVDPDVSARTKAAALINSCSLGSLGASISRFGAGSHSGSDSGSGSLQGSGLGDGAGEASARVPQWPGVVTLLNPVLEWESSARAVGWEGCLSIPGWWGLVERASAVHVRFETLDGRVCTERLRGEGARVLLHELDHLEGRVFLDRVRDPADGLSFLPDAVVRPLLERCYAETDPDATAPAAPAAAAAPGPARP